MPKVYTTSSIVLPLFLAGTTAWIPGHIYLLSSPLVDKTVGILEDVGGISTATTIVAAATCISTGGLGTATLTSAAAGEMTLTSPAGANTIVGKADG